MMSRRSILLLAAVAPVCVGAADMREVVVEREDGVYTMHSTIYFEAGLDELYAVLSDWDLAVNFSSVIVESRIIEPDEQGRPGFYSLNRGCVLFFCKSAERYGYVELERNEHIRSYIDPERSDFHVFDESWVFTVEGDGVEVSYELAMKPKFWIPPIIGPYVIKRKIRKDGERVMDRIEVIAQNYEIDGK